MLAPHPSLLHPLSCLLHLPLMPSILLSLLANVCTLHPLPSLPLMHSLPDICLPSPLPPSHLPSAASTFQAVDNGDTTKTTTVRVYVNITDLNEAPFFLRSHFYGEMSEYSIMDTVVVDHLEAQDLDYVSTHQSNHC